MSSSNEKTTIAVIEPRALVRECLALSLGSASGHTIVSFPDVDAWLEACEGAPAALVVLCTGGKSKEETQRAIALLSQAAHRTPTVLLSDTEEPDRIVEALGQGARGYIPTNVPLEVAVEAMRLVRAGGVFVPASSLMAMRGSANHVATPDKREAFTPRQKAVIEAIRRGKPNKIIAYELNMCESTVKVHVRTIMKKLRAKNRTEIAYLTASAAAS